MKSSYYKEVIPPNMQLRAYILKKLSSLKKMKQIEGTKGIVTKLRRALKSTEGQVRYYRVHKGIKMFIGTDKTSKKHFLLKDDLYFQKIIQERRLEYKAKLIVIKKRRVLKSGDHAIFYNTIGGVMENAEFFKKEIRTIKRKKVQYSKTPKTNDPYIGIELEFASSLNINQVTDMVVDLNLQDMVKVIRDGSINVNPIYPFQIEFCILTKYSELNKTLLALKPLIFDRPQTFQPNTSCGLHVHLDMRHDDCHRVFKNLVSMQTILFQMANENRRENMYCLPVPTDDFNEMDPDDDNAHYYAISAASYYKHTTIEVRIHHSTLDLTQIEKWINLLKRIADYKAKPDLEFGTIDSEIIQLKDKVKLEPELMQYVEGRKLL